MLSLYIHIPFCSQICSYCSFSILANQSQFITPYLDKLHSEIDFYASKYPKAEIKSIYFGGGTPNLIGSKEIKKLIDHCFELFDCENLAELSIECNPFPQDKILNFVKDLNNYYKKLSRLRFSFGIQSFDNAVLASVQRPYTFLGMVDFLRSLQPLKQDNNIFNFDFISFGKFNKTRKGNDELRNQSALDFFYNFANSRFADSFSLYTLERSPHFKLASISDDQIAQEFEILKEILLDAGYSRYEISNFCLPSKSSIHNRVYREMEQYLGLGMGASSLIIAMPTCQQKQSNLRTRTTNTPYISKYLDLPVQELASTVSTLSDKDILIEKFFLSLRTDRGISDLSAFKSVLVPDYKKKINLYSDEGFIVIRGDGFVLSDRGMDCYNLVITELLAEI